MTRILQAKFCLVLILACMILASACASSSTLHDFTSDGCSLFPDGTFGNGTLWCDCCFRHDITYWSGGTKEERLRADEILRDCVLERTNNTALAKMMYWGVRVGGHPIFPVWYRWGYGWDYGRGYGPLSTEEQKQVQEKLAEYLTTNSTSYCGDPLR